MYQRLFGLQSCINSGSTTNVASYEYGLGFPCAPRVVKPTMKIVDYLVQDTMKDEFDKSILHRRMADVNIRLFTTNEKYRALILKIIKYIEFHLSNTYSDYQAPSSVACAKLGFPFNIIGYKDQKSTIRVFLNPRIVGKSKDITVVHSNCGSFRLAFPLPASNRYNTIDLEFYDLTGHKIVLKGITRDQGGFSIQHEVDHSLGITITSKK